MGAKKKLRKLLEPEHLVLVSASDPDPVAVSALRLYVGQRDITALAEKVIGGNMDEQGRMQGHPFATVVLLSVALYHDRTEPGRSPAHVLTHKAL